MKLLKVILIVFIVYLIRRFFQFYKVMREIQANQMKAARQESASTETPSQDKVIDAEFKVMK